MLPNGRKVDAYESPNVKIRNEKILITLLIKEELIDRLETNNLLTRVVSKDAIVNIMSKFRSCI